MGLSWEHCAAFWFPAYWADLNVPGAWLLSVMVLIVLMSALYTWEVASTDD